MCYLSLKIVLSFVNTALLWRDVYGKTAVGHRRSLQTV